MKKKAVNDFRADQTKCVMTHSNSSLVVLTKDARENAIAASPPAASSAKFVNLFVALSIVPLILFPTFQPPLLTVAATQG